MTEANFADKAEPISVTLNELENGTVPFDTLDAAFGPNSLGIIVVKDLPLRFQPLRHKLLSYASYLANLPNRELGSVEPRPQWIASRPTFKLTLSQRSSKIPTRNGWSDGLAARRSSKTASMIH